MADYFYFDTNRQIRGPYDDQQLQELATQGIVKPNTMVTDDKRHWKKAIRIPGLVFQDGAVAQGDPVIFDIGFTRFISNTVNSIIWVICILAAIAACGYGVYAIVQDDAGRGIVIILFAIVGLLASRTLLELEVVIFRIESNTRVLSSIEEHLRVLREKSEK
jgi:hypothetical protein